MRKLEIFVKVAESEHVTRAGESLLLSQAAVSMAVAELEELAGSPLFKRQGRKLLLNDRGRLLLPEAREILQRAHNIENLLREASDELVGILHIGASTTIGNYLLPSLIAEFSRLYPRAQAHLLVGNTGQIEKGVDHGELDLGLIEGPCHAQALTSLPWRDDELVVIAGTQHPWAKKGRVTVRMLAAADWIMREKGSGTREVFEAAMAGRVDGFSTRLELGHTEAIKKAVEAGMGVSCLSRLAVQRELDQGWLVAVATPLELKRPLTILEKRDGYRSRLMTVFLDQLTANSMCRDRSQGIS